MGECGPTLGKGSWAAAEGDTAHSSSPASSGRTMHSGCPVRSMWPQMLAIDTITFSRITCRQNRLSDFIQEICDVD